MLQPNNCQNMCQNDTAQSIPGSQTIQCPPPRPNEPAGSPAHVHGMLMRSAQHQRSFEPLMEAPTSSSSVIANARREIAGISADMNHQLTVAPGRIRGGRARQIHSATAREGSNWHGIQQRRAQLMKEVGVAVELATGQPSVGGGRRRAGGGDGEDDDEVVGFLEELLGKLRRPLLPGGGGGGRSGGGGGGADSAELHRVTAELAKARRESERGRKKIAQLTTERSAYASQVRGPTARHPRTGCSPLPAALPQRMASPCLPLVAAVCVLRSSPRRSSHWRSRRPAGRRAAAGSRRPKPPAAAAVGLTRAMTTTRRRCGCCCGQRLTCGRRRRRTRTRGAGRPTTWTTVQHDGPNHLGL